MRRVLSAVGYCVLGFVYFQVALFVVQLAAFLILGVRLYPLDFIIALGICAYFASLARYGNASFGNWLIMCLWSLSVVLAIPFFYYAGRGGAGKRPAAPPIDERDQPKPIIILTCHACGATNPCTNVSCNQCGGPLPKPGAGETQKRDAATEAAAPVKQ